MPGRAAAYRSDMTFYRAQRGKRDLEPIAVVDIGSNSVRLVVYEGAIRAPTPVFNEKIQCGLGKGLAKDGRLASDSVARAIRTLRRYRALARTLGVKNLRVIATAAVREASNGPEFIARAERAIQQQIEILSGEREAELAAAGIQMGFAHPDGLAGDLGGGSLELVGISGTRQLDAATLPLGVIRLADESAGDLGKAAEIIERELDRLTWLDEGTERAFYPVGGTWRSIAKLHMHTTDYPLRVMHGYDVDAALFGEFSSQIVKSVLRRGKYRGQELVSKARRDLLPLGALVIERTLARAASKRVVFSVTGIREGLLYRLLSGAEQQKDALLVACTDLAAQRSRSLEHAFELKRWTDPLFGPGGLNETAEETRLREAACLISDIGWRAHPDYRAEQSLDTVANSAFTCIDHPGRVYLAMSTFFRHSGLNDPPDQTIPARLRSLLGDRLLLRARVAAGALRTAHMLSAGMPGIIDETRLEIKNGHLNLVLPPAHADLDGERLRRRFAALASQLGLESAVKIDTAT